MTADSPSQPSLLDEILAAHLRASERGENPSRHELLTRHPDLANELREFFADHDRMNRLAQPLCEPTLGSPAIAAADRIRYFGDYEVLEEIARGGMGVVFKARQVTLNRIVAIKMILSGHLASPADVERFHTEAEAAAKLDHPGIVPIYEVGQHEGQHYFSMGFVDGISLSAKVAPGPLPAREAAELVRTVAEAVQYAHENGVIHRDLKPGNILLDRHGKPRITDFGLAKLTESLSDLTGTGQILGTPGYMPPEQAAAHLGAVGPSSDIYALGAILYCLLTGRPPFQAATSIETLLQVQNQEPIPPRVLNPAIPVDLDTIVLKCLEKPPARRYSSAREISEELERFLDGRPILARPIARTARLWRTCRRNPVVAGLVALLLLALIAITATSTVGYFRELAHRREIEGKNAEISRALAGESRAKDEATDRLYRSLVDQARANRLSRRMGQRYMALEILAEASRMAGKMSRTAEDVVCLRSEAIACLTLTDVRVSREWEGCPIGTFHVDFDDALERYARVDRKGEVGIRRVADDRELLRITGLTPGETWATLSPNGQFVGLITPSQCEVWNLGGAKAVLVLAKARANFAFGPDSRQFAIRDAAGTVTRFELPSGRQRAQIETGTGGGMLAFDPLGRQLAVCCRDGIQILDFETGTLNCELAGTGDARFIAWHPAGQLLGAVGDDRVIRLWDIAAARLTTELRGLNNDGIMFTFNHRGDLLAGTNWDGKLSLWDPTTGVRLPTPDMTMRAPLHFSPDDQRLAAAAPTARQIAILEIAPVRNFYRTLARDPVLGPGIYYEPAVSPDGRLVCVGMRDGVGIWDVNTGTPLKFLPLGQTFSVRFEPSGAILTSGPAGVLRWPIAMNTPLPGQVRIGSGERIPLPGHSASIGLSADGLVVAKAMNGGTLVWHKDSPAPPISLAPHDDVRAISVSPDGRLIATGAFGDTHVKIWDAVTGKLARELTVGGASGVCFSPDGRWLLTTFNGNRLWDTNSWQDVCTIGGTAGVAFSPDGRILAVEQGGGVIRLVNPETGRDYARLEDPDANIAHRLTFAPDGAQLVATKNDSSSIHLWELSAIREHLDKLGLDWDLPKLRPAAAARLPLTLEEAAQASPD